MNSSTMLILGTGLVLVLPLSLVGFFNTANSTMLVISMLGVVTFPVGAVMLYVGFKMRKQNKQN